MRFERLYSPASGSVEDVVRWRTVETSSGPWSGSIEVPAGFSERAAGIVGSKYLRKAQVPSETRRSIDHGDVPDFLRPSVPVVGATFGAETSARQIFRRLSGAWAYHGWREDLFDSEEDALVFRDEAFAILALQLAAPNSPQWFNCFGGNERFVTKEFGSVPLSHVVGYPVTVWTRQGWKPARVESFGRQPVQTVEFTPAFRHHGGGWSTGKCLLRREITVTLDHRWITKERGQVTDLRIGDIVPSSVVKHEDDSDYRYGFQHGVIFGDGTFHYNSDEKSGLKRFFVRLIGDRKRKLAEMFDQVSAPPFLEGDLDAVVEAYDDLKDFPSEDRSSSYICGFLDGWVATDGSKKNSDGYRLSTTNERADEWMKINAATCGWMITGYGVDDSLETNYGVRSGQVRVFSVTQSERAWRVTQIIDRGEETEVFCAIVPEIGEFTLADGIVTGNCGLWWAYGIEGPDTGQWRCDPTGVPRRVATSYVHPQPHACFLNSVADDLVNEGGIMDLWTREARVFKHGAGSGVNISALRGPTEGLSGGGTASGAMSFVEVGDRSAGAIQSGGTTRRAAKMLIMDDDHPEVERFVDWKVGEEWKAAAMAVGSTVARDDPRWPSAVRDRLAAGIDAPELSCAWEGEAIRTVSGQNSNNSIRVTDRFVEAALSDGEWELRARTTGAVVERLRARALLDRVARAAWAVGDPGILCHDTINAWHTCPAGGEITTTNPCAEYHFLTDTACNLLSLNLGRFISRDEIGPWDAADRWLDLRGYEHVARVATVILEISVEMASFPSAAFAVGTWRYRTLGLGYADLGGALMRLALPYDSEAGRGLAAGLTSVLTGVAYRTSAEMAEAVGAFPVFEENADAMRRVLRNHARAGVSASVLDRRGIDRRFEGLNVAPHVEPIPPRLQERIDEIWGDVLDARAFRNAQATVLAPTGTISFAMDCDTTGIEPDLGLVKEKKLAGGGSMERIANRAVPEALGRLGMDAGQVDAVAAWVAENGRVEGCPFVELSEEELAVFDTSNAAPGGTRSIRPMGHLLMVAAVQPFLSGAASKTINFPNGATVGDFADAFVTAHRLGLKAVAPFRDGSKLDQPLRAVGAVTEPPTADLRRGEREYLPWRRERGFAQKVRIGDQSVHFRVGEYDDGRPGELFTTLSHAGSDLRSWAEFAMIGWSLALQYGAPVEEVVEKMVHLKFAPAGIVEGHERVKMASSVADYIGRELGITYLGRDDLGHVRPARPAPPLAVVASAERRTVPTIDARAAAIALGYAGRPCPNCDSFRTRHTGPCLGCEDCGESTGCG